MKLQQGQLWKKGNEYIRIVNWARLDIEYKLITDLESGEGTFHELSKKEFCRLLRGAELIEPPTDQDSDEETLEP
ncbi:hypothetical protein ACFQY0_14670 [Haloferula chungangensis]|uniref:Uncharacterized protein n=1 Tax=Haloferula chungangensis TaxID=1048331 RepID=A0ABW2LA13_9BACT